MTLKLDTLDPATEQFLAYILAKRYSEAKDIVLNTSLWSGSERLIGRRAGCLGLISKIAQRADDFFNTQWFAELKQMLLRLQSSFDCDEFEKGYIDVWLKFIDNSLSGEEEGVKENPSEEE
ncbi:MAG: hypothetical protein QXW32_00670 [Nitrososphaerales archaeon]